MDMPKSAFNAADTGAYTDLNRLNSLKVGDRDSDANLRKVAQEFESLFLNEMLKSMRSASDVLAKDNPLNTETTKQYQQMYDQQLAVSMSREGGGIGLQEVLMRQLSKQKASAATNNSPFPRVDTQQRPLWAAKVAEPVRSEETAVTRNDMAALNSRRLALPGKLTDRLLAGIVPSAGTAAATTNTAALPQRTTAMTDAVVKGDWQSAQSFAAPGSMRIYGRAVAQPPLAPAKRAFGSSDEFVATMLPMAEQAAKRIGIDPRYLVAQAALETGWASRSCVRPMAAAATTCSASRPPATGRAARRGRSPASSVTVSSSRRPRRSAPTIPTRTASMTWSACYRTTRAIKKRSRLPINRNSLYASCRKPVTQPTRITRARFRRSPNR